MIKKLILITTLSVVLTGCYMAPLALIGPATSGFTTASIIQSGMTTGANYVIKKSTGKTISEHAFGSVSKDVMTQTFLPEENIHRTEDNLLMASPKK